MSAREFTITYLTIENEKLETVERTVTIMSTDKVSAVNNIEKVDAGFIALLGVQCNA